MRRDPEATRARILEAALVEFAEHGVHGARYERIAARAQANRERIYAYFGEKEALFATVLAQHMGNLAEAHLIRDSQALADHAGELFDFHLAHPELTRLLLWEALHYGTGEVPGEAHRAEHYRRRRQAVEDVLSGGGPSGDGPSIGDRANGDTPATGPGAMDPGHLSFVLTSLVAWWFAAPQMARLHVDDDISDPDVQQRHRDMVVELAGRLLAAADGGRGDVPPARP
jgi:AcrR family transcriptional regulator